jgi:hypothetical protein
MARFVILTHDWPSPHWDFLVEVEANGVLRAWRLFDEPRPGADVRAEANAPHRPHYLDYEGPVSGNRGTVVRWDWGTCDWARDEPDRVEVRLRGARLTGTVAVWEAQGVWWFRLTASG